MSHGTALTEYLKREAPTLLYRCSNSFLARAKQAQWPIEEVLPDSFARIYLNVGLLISGTPQSELKGLEWQFYFLGSANVDFRLPCVVELYLSAESCLRDHMLMDCHADFSPVERGQLFEEVNRAFHTLLENDLPVLCGECMEPTREQFQRVTENGRWTDKVLQCTVDSRCAWPGQRKSLRFVLDDNVEIDTCMLRVFLDERREDVLDAWLLGMEGYFSSDPAGSLAPHQGVLGYCLDGLKSYLTHDAASSTELPRGAPVLGRRATLLVCMVGEETIAALLAPHFEAIGNGQVRARRAINQAFHALLRGLIYSECGGCAAKLAHLSGALTQRPYSPFRNPIS